MRLTQELYVVLDEWDAMLRPGQPVQPYTSCKRGVNLVLRSESSALVVLIEFHILKPSTLYADKRRDNVFILSVSASTTRFALISFLLMPYNYRTMVTRLYDKAPTILAISAFFIPICFVFVVLRLWIRQQKNGILVDDWLLLSGLVKTSSVHRPKTLTEE